MEKIMHTRLNGKRVNAFTWSEYATPPQQFPRGIWGKLDGVAYEFPRTRGKGRNVFYCHYIWFIHDGELWMIQTGEEWPSEIYLLTSHVINDISVKRVYDYLRGHE